MNKLRKQIALVFVALFATVCVFSSCSEEESMIDAEREHKVQELFSVSKALAKKHEIGLCFTERMIRGGIDTLTVEDLEQAYEVYAANTVEFYVCTDSVMANENGLKLSRSTRIMGEEVILQLEDGGSVQGEFQLIWTPNDNLRAAINYSGLIQVRIDWGYYIDVIAYAHFAPNSYESQGAVALYGINHDLYYNPFNYIVFECQGRFTLYFDDMHCEFAVWAKETVYTQRLMRLTLLSSFTNGKGEFNLVNNGGTIPF